MIRIDIRKPLQGAGGTMELRIDLTIKERTFLTVAGESGSGKTTFLRILAGLEQAEGEIEVDQERWLDDKTCLPPQKRRIGFVFQDYALFENMKVLENLLFVRRDERLAWHLLHMTDLVELADRYPAGLSGGQKQRVALCRAMMNRPRLLLMDEPLSALDPAMRQKLQKDILHLHKEFGTTTVMVSHDPGEIYQLADRVVTLSQGRVVADTTPAQLFFKERSGALSFHGELLDLISEAKSEYAVISVGNQITKIPITPSQSFRLKDIREIRIVVSPECAQIEPIPCD